MKLLIVISLLGMSVLVSMGEELIDVISVSPDNQYQIAIIYPSPEAKQKDKGVAPSKANYSGRPIVLIDTRSKQRVKIEGGGIAGDVSIEWIKGTDCLSYYERDEACWTHVLYRIVRKPRLKLAPIKLPCVKDLVTKLGDLPDVYYDAEYEFLSQEFMDYSQKGEVRVSLVTRSQVGRGGVTPTLCYTVTFKTESYRLFKPVFVTKSRYVKGEDPIASVILLNK